MANTALKKLMKTDLIEMIRGNIANSNDYYLFVSRATPYTDNAATTTVVESDVTPPSIGESSRNYYDTVRNLVFLKRIRTDNMKLVIPRVDWTYNTAYTPYSETTDMADTQYYVMTSDYNVYKCMGASGLSKIMPTGKSTDVITLSDGYKWKYLYTVLEDYYDHLTLDYIPVFVADELIPEQKNVQDQSVPSSIDRVSMSASLSPTFDKIFRIERSNFTTVPSFVADVGTTANIAGSTYITFSPVGEQDEPATGFWNNYAIYVTSGPGVGQYFRIVNFVKAGAGTSYYYASVYPAIQRDLSVAQSKFKVVPYIVVDGDGTNAVVVPQTSTAKKITSLTLVNPGTEYTYANPRLVTESGSVSLGSAVATFNASLSADLSIPAGHGANVVKELGASDLMIVVELDGTEGGKFSVRNDYRQFGILKSPYLYGGITLAGEEEDISLKALIKKIPTKQDLYDLNNNTFKVGNYIIGKETRATARILDSETIPGMEFQRLYLTDVVGEFRFSSDSSVKKRAYYGAGFTGTFATGDAAMQYVAGLGTTLSASGTILSYDTGEKSLYLDTTYGAFTEGKPFYFLGASGSYSLGTADVIDVDQEFGELIGQFSLGSTSGSEFLTFGSTLSDEIFGRLASTYLEPTIVEDLGEYDTTTKIQVVNSSPFTDGIISGSAAVDGTITQTNSSTLRKTTADVIDFVVSPSPGLTGTLRLSNVKGSFNVTDTLTFTPYGTTADSVLNTVTINSITTPDIKIGSGELLYIENVRPIERNIEQSEEYKIVIGF